MGKISYIHAAHTEDEFEPDSDRSLEATLFEAAATLVGFMIEENQFDPHVGILVGELEFWGQIAREHGTLATLEEDGCRD